MGSVANYYHVNGQWRSRENLTGVNVFLRPLQHAVNGIAFMDGGGGATLHSTLLGSIYHGRSV